MMRILNRHFRILKKKDDVIRRNYGSIPTAAAIFGARHLRTTSSTEHQPKRLAVAYNYVRKEGLSWYII